VKPEPPADNDIVATPRAKRYAPMQIPDTPEEDHPVDEDPQEPPATEPPSEGEELPPASTVPTTPG
jgi:hypothetical protein